MSTPHTSSARTYRATIQADSGEARFQTVLDSTDLYIVTSNSVGIPTLREQVLQEIRQLRGQIEAYSLLHPAFLTSLVPLPDTSEAPPLIMEMLDAARICNVGPMAGVAGTISQHIAQLLAGSPVTADALVENGGDTYIISRRERVIGVLPDPAEGVTLGITIQAEAPPCSICASSSFIGHSLSLGQGDLVAVRAHTGALADCAATALCNMLKSRQDIDTVLRQAEAWASYGLTGILTQSHQQIAAWGDIELAAV